MIRINPLCFTIVVPICMLEGALTVEAGQGTPSPSEQMALSDAIPPPAFKLFQWPSEEVLNGPNRLQAQDQDVLGAAWQCQTWFGIALAPVWQPPKETELIFLQDEFDGRDVVRSEWKKNGYWIQASQTASIFTITLTPLDGGHTGVTQTEKTAATRSLCLKVFPESGRRYSYADSGEPIKVPVENLAEKIALWSFADAKIQYLEADDTVVGFAPEPPAELLVERKTEEELRRELSPANPNWHTTQRSYDYWFRKICWWNDGRSIGFYFLKVEEGPRTPNYAAGFDRGFFRYIGPHHKETSE